MLEEERRGAREQILDRMNVGDLVTGTISNIVDFGAFVDLEGIDGLIHISELSWSHVNHPSEVLTIGQKVEVRVLDIDRDRQRISLGLKQTQKDPWQQVFENRQVNEIVHGRSPNWSRSAPSSRSRRVWRASSTSPNWLSTTWKIPQR